MLRLLPLAAILVMPATAAADDLSDIVERDKIAVQKLMAEVNDAFAEARAFESADPAKAKRVLQGALAKIADSNQLAEDERASLRRRVQARLIEITRLARAREIADEAAARRDADKKSDRSDDPANASKTSDTAKRYVANAQDQISAAQRLRDRQAKGHLGVLSSLEASATPIDGVVEYPKYWAKLTESRKNFTGTRLTAKEVALLKALNATMSVDFKSAPFKDVLEYLQQKTGLAIIVDENSLKEAMVEYNDPVTFKVNKVTVRTVLKKILADRGLGYILKEGNVQVVSSLRARETMVIRSYPIDDLIGGLNTNLYGPFVNRANMLSNVQGLIQTIQHAIDPGLWNVNGGPGSITFNEASRALIIRAPAEMHYMFGGGGLLGR